MALSARLPRELEQRLRKTAEAEGISVSEALRRAAVRYCDEQSTESLEDRISDVLGVVSSKGGRADRTGEAFKKALAR